MNRIIVLFAALTMCYAAAVAGPVTGKYQGMERPQYSKSLLEEIRALEDLILQAKEADQTPDPVWYERLETLTNGAQEERGQRSLDQGGDDCASAFLIEALPFADCGNTTEALNDYNVVCPYQGGTARDVVYKYIPASNMSMTVSLCRSSFDTKLYIYRDVCSGTPIACSDDTDPLSCPGGANRLRSYIEAASLQAGHTYYIVVDGHGYFAGDYCMDVLQAVNVICPSVADPEGEPAYTDNYVDNYNGGCDFGSNQFATISCGETVCGTAGSYVVFQDGAPLTRFDTDWYQFTITAPETVTFCMTAEASLRLSMYRGSCPDTIPLAAATAAPGEQICIGSCLQAGTYFVRVAAEGLSGWRSPEYFVTMNCAPCVPLQSPFNCACQFAPNTECNIEGGPINDLQVTEVPIEIPYAYYLTDLNVCLDITHTWDGDLAITLQSPAGTIVALCARRGGSGDDFQCTEFDDEANTPIGSGSAPFNGVYIPEEPLSAFDGQNVQGTWMLRVSDEANLDHGTVNGVCLNMTGTFAPPGELCDLPLPLEIPCEVEGNTCGFADDLDAACPDPSNAPDVVYSFTVGENDWYVTFSICEAEFDPKLYVFDGSCEGEPIACSDDNVLGCFHSERQIPEAAYIHCLQLLASHTYYLVVDGGTDGSCGPYLLQADFCEPPCVECPPEARLEGEPTCYNYYGDTFNMGCYSDPPSFTPISCGDVICGTTGSFVDSFGISSDWDWYELNLTERDSITVVVESEISMLVYIAGSLYPSGGCTDEPQVYGYTITPACGFGYAGVCLEPGTYWVALYPYVDQQVPCGTRYTMGVQCEPCGPGPDGDVCETALPLEVPAIVGECFYRFHDDYHEVCDDDSVIGGRDVVYTVTLPEDAYVTFDLCAYEELSARDAGKSEKQIHDLLRNRGAASSQNLDDPEPYISNAKVYIYADECGGDPIACSDSALPCYEGATSARITCLLLESSRTYYVVVDEGNRFVPWGYCYELNVTECAEGESCEMALPIESLPYSADGYTCDATDDYVGPCGSDPDDRDIVYRYTAPVDQCVEMDLCEYDDYDTKLYVFADVCTGVQIACNDDWCGLQSRLEVQMSAGHSYYIVVDGYSEGDCGEYYLYVYEQEGGCEGGEDCATATAILSLPDTLRGNTCDFDDDYEACGGWDAPDVVFSYTPPSDQVIDVSLCSGADFDQYFDTDLYVFEDDCYSEPIACNDDFCGNDGELSRLPCLSVLAGHTYYIVVDGDDEEECGEFEMIIAESQNSCEVECPLENTPEGEPDCYPGYIDETNGGCWSGPVQAFGEISCSQTICGTMGAFEFYDEENGEWIYFWDEDWYTIEIEEPVFLSVCGVAEALFWSSIYGPANGIDCSDGVYYYGSTEGYAVPGDTSCFGACLAPGRYWVTISPEDYTPCGSEYYLWVTCEQLPPIHDLTVAIDSSQSFATLSWTAPAYGMTEIWWTGNPSNDGDPYGGDEADTSTWVHETSTWGGPGRVTTEDYNLTGIDYKTYAAVFFCGEFNPSVITAKTDPTTGHPVGFGLQRHFDKEQRKAEQKAKFLQAKQEKKRALRAEKAAATRTSSLEKTRVNARNAATVNRPELRKEERREHRNSARPNGE